MKKILKSLYIVFLLFIITSCHENILEETAYDQLAQSAFPKTLEDLDLVVNGIYTKMGYYHVRYGAYNYVCLFNSVEGCMKQRGGGNTRGAGDHYNWHEYLDYRDSFIRHFFWAWEGITQSNEVINALDQIETDKQKVLNRAEGEAKAFRAWFYFDLVRFYGAMPLVEKSPSLNNEELYIERPSDVRVSYDFIIKDLQEAIELLPTKTEYADDSSLGDPGRISKAVAQMLLAKVYLTMSGYPLNDNSKLSDAKSLLESIKNSGQYKLIDDYKEVFSMDNELNDEIIYAIQNNPFTGGQELYTMSRMLPPDQTNQYWGSYQGWLPQDGATLEFMLKFKESDGGVRYQHSIAEQWTNPANGDTVKALDYGNAWITKFSMPEGYVNGSWFTPVDFTLLRYADVLLMLAELETELANGVSSAAVDYLNQIRTRAGHPNYYNVGDFSSKEDLIDTIFWERSMELAFEHHGVFDLRRRGYEKLKEIVTSKLWYDPEISTNNAQDFSYITSGQIPESHMLYPIPPDYLNQNPKFVQNPGY
ncbi:RagB/SusD family nutrient uptake outer membrane protein [uncultured Draconibacterium sp.]|uniref:RagB/SusD family nutrient uptake outer membrane protein n=1 Tax=uncultured Draconibacterium sp. TaxID=1573823 RepID=UPI003260D515